MPHRRTLFTAAGAVLLLAGRGPASAAEPGVGAKRILFGQAAVLEGAAAALGRGMRDGIAAAFAEANRAGGVKGRMLELLSRDDGYEPAQSERMTRALVEQEGVFALSAPSAPQPPRRRSPWPRMPSCPSSPPAPAPSTCGSPGSAMW